MALAGPAAPGYSAARDRCEANEARRREATAVTNGRSSRSAGQFEARIRGATPEKRHSGRYLWHGTSGAPRLLARPTRARGDDVELSMRAHTRLLEAI